MNRLKSKACKGFLFYLNHNELVYFSFVAKIQYFMYVSVILFAVKKENSLNAIPSCMVLLA